MTETEYVSSPVLAALERAWAEIRHRNPDVPEVIVIIASGTETKAAKLGHFADGRWERYDGKQWNGKTDRHEMMVAGEGLKRPAAEVLSTLLHEAAHGIATTRKIKDTSNRNRYHNRQFKMLAEEVGLVVQDYGKPYGLAGTTLSNTGKVTYAETLADLESAVTIARRAERRSMSKTSKPRPKARCQCEPPREMTLSKRALAAGPVICGLCEEEFSL